MAFVSKGTIRPEKDNSDEEDGEGRQAGLGSSRRPRGRAEDDEDADAMDDAALLDSSGDEAAGKWSRAITPTAFLSPRSFPRLSHPKGMAHHMVG